MPITMSAPGVYVEENNVASLAVTSGATAVPVFAAPAGSLKAGVVRVDSWLGFLASAQVVGTGGFDAGNLLHVSLRAYFENGGGPCYLVEASALLEQLPLLDDVTLLVAAGQDINGAVNTLCTPGSGLFALLDAPQDLPESPTTAQGPAIATRSPSAGADPGLPTSRSQEGRQARAGASAAAGPQNIERLKALPREHAAAYFPWLMADWAVTQKAEVLTFRGIPPSAAVAGVFCTVDRSRGVWKAPANVALKGLVPCVAVSNGLQSAYLDGDLAVNMIRRFSGAGTLVHGARTRSADPNWRYIPVRRLFDSAQRDIRRAMSFAVFEPNSQPTWERVRAAIASYLRGLWLRGALMGNTEQEAFFVSVGMGITMSQADISAGRMLVDVGMAAARPAEFILLQFSQRVEQG